MRVRLLGTAAGGGLPQWNCNCPNCRDVRRGDPRLDARTQSCVALSGDGQHWYLLNASPDIRTQIESFPPLCPTASARGTRIEGVLLTSADLDHVLGLWSLREGERLTVTATAQTRSLVDSRLRLSATLDCYGGISWQPASETLAPLPLRGGAPSLISYCALRVPGTLPRYASDQAEAGAVAESVGYVFVDELTQARLLYLPGMATITPCLREAMQAADVLLLDGTFWSEDELAACGAGQASASQMGHLPVGGPTGSLAQLGVLAARTIFVHLNNTNPMLRRHSPEYQAVRAQGAEIGWDGLDLDVQRGRDICDLVASEEALTA